MNKKVIVRIIIVVMLLLFVPIPLHLKDGGTVVYRAVLYKLTKYHKIAMDTTVETEAGTIVESGHHVGWGIEILGMEIFNNVKYVPDTNSQIEVKDDQKDFLKDILKDYTLEDARLDGCVCFDNGNITEGQKIWDEFVNATNTQENATVRLAFYYSLDEEQCDAEYYECVKDEYPVLYIQELTYKDNSYLIGTVLGKYQLGISDSFVHSRIENMINEGQLEVVSAAKKDMPVYSRVLKRLD